MANHDDRRATLLELIQGGDQSLLAVGVQIGVRLVENHQTGIVVEARARAMRWRCPPERFSPLIPISVP